MNSQQNWKTLSCFIDLDCPWLRLIGEKLENEQGQILDYWRIEKADSVVIITLQNERLLFPRAMYRPGLGKVTLDFPGGRVSEGKSPLEVVPDILQRELGIREEAIIALTPLNETGWAINSSFSNQKLYGFVAQLSSNLIISPEYLAATYPTSKQGIKELLKNLTCLQCRSLLLEWQIQALSVD
ncbi:NUDIX hydrolase [Gloeothece verrucosa]|uniref:NUDIX hydrolase n=1 Tax=Gloeothece verrucosa (strain PCC 7822) TaxID=497965 RepID=E0UJU5_GLOV7|nr:NUDIX hydrolase [Gloeothece verrucosa]ADN13456.1 conserved hypothetical protein [Gloeothece verrucosa PCC 7822]